MSARRDTDLIKSLIEQVRNCALYRPLLFCVDGLITYVSVIQKVFAIPIVNGKRGRPCLKAWENLCIVRVIKHVSGKPVAGITQRIACGTWKQACLLIKQTQNTSRPYVNAHTAYIERINGTFRSRITALVRRGRSLVRQNWQHSKMGCIWLELYTISAIHIRVCVKCCIFQLTVIAGFLLRQLWQ